jgi:hypothetical protein
MQPDLFQETPRISDCGAGSDVRTPEIRGRSAKRRSQTLRQRRALARLAEQQQRYDRTRSHTALQRLRDAVNDCLRLGV